MDYTDPGQLSRFLSAFRAGVTFDFHDARQAPCHAIEIPPRVYVCPYPSDDPRPLPRPSNPLVKLTKKPSSHEGIKERTLINLIATSDLRVSSLDWRNGRKCQHDLAASKPRQYHSNLLHQLQTVKAHPELYRDRLSLTNLALPLGTQLMWVKSKELIVWELGEGRDGGVPPVEKGLPMMEYVACYDLTPEQRNARYHPHAVDEGDYGASFGVCSFSAAVPAVVRTRAELEYLQRMHNIAGGGTGTAQIM